MEPNIGSALQAMKYVEMLATQVSFDVACMFASKWLEGDVVQDNDYLNFCADNPDPIKEKEHKAADGTVRQQHYGSGRQPWDDIKDAGWGPEFCAGNALKYIRRDHTIKGVERDRDLKHARWYYDRLVELVDHGAVFVTIESRHAAKVMVAFQALLNKDELALLQKPAEKAQK